jgi:hypothetical protein
LEAKDKKLVDAKDFIDASLVADPAYPKLIAFNKQLLADLTMLNIASGADMGSDEVLTRYKEELLRESRGL